MLFELLNPKQEGMGLDDNGDTIAMECQMCSHVLQESDGFYYCQECDAQGEGLMDTGVCEGVDGRAHPCRRWRLVTPIATVDKSSLIWLSTQEQEDAATAANNNYNNSGNHSSIRTEPDYNYGSYNDDGLGLAEPEDFGSAAVAKLG